MTLAPLAPLAHRTAGTAAVPSIPAQRPTAQHPAAPLPVLRNSAELPAYAQAQPYLSFPGVSRPAPPRPPVGRTSQPVRRAAPVSAPASVLATRVVGLVLTALCALSPVWFAVMALAFGLGLNSVVGMAIGALIGTVAIGWPVGFWFATAAARQVWPVLIALVPTVLVAAATLWLVLGR